jgi:hypothetical protein
MFRLFNQATITPYLYQEPSTVYLLVYIGIRSHSLTVYIAKLTDNKYMNQPYKIMRFYIKIIALLKLYVNFMQIIM